jgi:P-type E1-E2 ATPase
MFPEAKMKVINALKNNGEIVAMTGDGVNDGPALKTADIGIAMGLKGTEIARQAADLILTDDNIDKITEALKQGRKIFNNLKKRFVILFPFTYRLSVLPHCHYCSAGNIQLCSTLFTLFFWN